MANIKLNEAILYASAKAGRKISQKEVGKELFPESSIESQQINLSKLITGKTKRISVITVQRICKKLGVDANFLFDVEPMQK